LSPHESSRPSTFRVVALLLSPARPAFCGGTDFQRQAAPADLQKVFHAGSQTRQKVSVDRIAAIFKLPNKVEPVAESHSVTPRTPAQPSATKEKINVCDCGKKYPGKRHKEGGCPDCRKDYLAAHHRDKRIQLSRETIADGEAVEVA